MDSRVILFIAALTGAAAILVNVVLGAVVRLRELRSRTPDDIEARLERIEAAVEAIAIEVERTGELQRFNAQVSAGMALPAPRETPKTITPH